MPGYRNPAAPGFSSAKGRGFWPEDKKVPQVADSRLGSSYTQ